MNEILLIVGALVPAIILGIYIYKKDRAEKEPVGLLILLLFSGVVIIVPILIVSIPVDLILVAIFNIETGVTNSLFDYIGHGVDALSVGVIEEGFKWLALIIITKNNKNFNSLFDGVIYAVFVSLGFAGVENILYVLDYGWTTAVLRALTAVTGHVFFGVMMGYFYSMWHMTSKAKLVEDAYKKEGLVPLSTKCFPVAKYAVMSYVVPVIAHGFYDFGCFTGTTLGVLCTYGFLIFMYGYCFRKVKMISKVDVSDTSYVKLLLVRKYPHLERKIYEDEYNAIEAQQIYVQEVPVE